MSRVVIVPNPGYTGEPRVLDPVCHDRSPFITVQCGCGNQMHLHETQLDLPEAAVMVGWIVTRCPACGDELEMGYGQLLGAFAQMREDGWIAP